ncbi:acyl carrier protein [Streptomyces sp. NPDC098789]|uniref:acyl carrier protein n=1 Tax=unclassified Streptomyces TaxID=2593676 RepID=UPI002E816CDA|nr:acyl carrier protein [Streptomyces sp. NBC_00536]WUC80843.1 acyl carrier protein [Streptomyces sp. NBC_00536]
MLNEQNIQQIIEREIQSVVLSSEEEEVSLDDELLKSGVNSLMLAQLLIQLETELGVDPFAADLSITEIRTLRELVGAYEAALERAASAGATAGA